MRIKTTFFKKKRNIKEEVIITKMKILKLIKEMTQTNKHTYTQHNIDKHKIFFKKLT